MEGKLGSRHSLLIGEFSSVATFKHFQGTTLTVLMQAWQLLSRVVICTNDAIDI